MKRTESESESEERSETSRRTSGSEREGVASNVRSDPVTSLHRSVGNRTLQRAARDGDARPELEVSDPDDPAEREAERVAESVMRSPDRGDGRRRDPPTLIETVGPGRGAPVRARRSTDEGAGGAGGTDLLPVQRKPEGETSNGGGDSSLMGSIGETVSQGLEQAGEAISWAGQQVIEIVQKALFETPGVIVKSTTAYESPPSGQGQGTGGGSGGEGESGGESRQESGSSGGSGGAGGSGGQSEGQSVPEGTQVFVRRLTLVNGSPWYEAEVKTSSGIATRYVPKDSVMLWYGSVNTGPEEVRSEAEEGGSDGGGGSETKDGKQQPGAARERMVRLAQQEWKQKIEDFDISDTTHPLDNGTAHILGDIKGKIDASKVKITTETKLEENKSEMKNEGVKVAVTGVPEGKDHQELKGDITKILNIYVATGNADSAIGSEYTGGVDMEHWCARFVGSVARSAGVRQDVIEKTLWSTTRAYEGSLEKSIRDDKQVPTDTPALKQVDGDPQPGDIVTVKQWEHPDDGDKKGPDKYRGVYVGGHVALAAGAPQNGYLPTIEGNGQGWHPGGEWSEGIIKRFRTMSGEDGVKQIYRLTEEHFEGGESGGSGSE